MNNPLTYIDSDGSVSGLDMDMDVAAISEDFNKEFAKLVFSELSHPTFVEGWEEWSNE